MKRVVIAEGRRIEYTLIQTVRKSVLFQALPAGEIRVYAPKAMRLRDIDAMVRERRALRLARGRRVSAEITADEFRLTLPDPDSDEAVRAAIRSALSTRALERIRERLAFYIPRVGKQPGRITIREQKSRWGSCSSKHNLNFNWKLIMAPPQALDYVVIHELCHLHEFNHSPRFWSLVEAQMPDYKVWKKWLKDHAEDLYL